MLRALVWMEHMALGNLRLNGRIGWRHEWRVVCAGNDATFRWGTCFATHTPPRVVVLLLSCSMCGIESQGLVPS